MAPPKKVLTTLVKKYLFSLVELHMYNIFNTLIIIFNYIALAESFVLSKAVNVTRQNNTYKCNQKLLPTSNNKQILVEMRRKPFYIRLFIKCSLRSRIRLPWREKYIRFSFHLELVDFHYISIFTLFFHFVLKISYWFTQTFSSLNLATQTTSVG